jgi:hypothetical protein
MSQSKKSGTHKDFKLQQSGSLRIGLGGGSSPSPSVSSTTSSVQQHRPYPSLRSSPAHRDPTIRHAGRAHIRGKIRRVWRPRYLELCDTGLIRYYELPPTADITLPEDSDWDHVHMIPKDTLLVYSARIIDVTTLRDLHVGLPRGSYGFLFRGQRQASAPDLLASQEPIAPREFFCAVPALEEAQTWVVALQWAATVCRPQLLLRNNSEYTPDYNWMMETSQHPHSQHAVSPSPTMVRDIPPPPPPLSPKKPPSGTIVVTRVQRYRLVRLKQFQFEIAYEIDLLLLSRQRKSGGTTTNGSSVPPPLIEERRILRTPQDLRTLVHQLRSQLLPNDDSSHPLLDKMVLVANSLPTFDSPIQDWKKSLSIVDGMLRALAMEADVVNSQAVKECFSLGVVDDDDDTTANTNSRLLRRNKNSNRTWQCHDARSISQRKVLIIPPHTTVDDFVKTWLAKQQQSNDNTMMWQDYGVWVVQRPWVLVGAGGGCLAMLSPAIRLYHGLVGTVHIRLDTLVITWLGAAWLGRNYWPRRTITTETTAATRRMLRSSCVAKKPKSNNNISSLQRTSEPSSIATGAPLLDDDDAQGSDGSAADYERSREEEELLEEVPCRLSSPLPVYPANNGESCWSIPQDKIFRVRGETYLDDRIKAPSGASPFQCLGVDIWMTDNPQRHIARHPSVLGGKLKDQDTFLVNFLLPFGNFVSYFAIPSLDKFPPELANVWTKFLSGDQQYRDARLKLLPVVVDGPWIVKAAVGNGTAPALLGKVIPLQYFFREPDETHKGVYEVDVIITASTIAKGILSVVKGHTKALSIAFAFIIEAAEQEELPETVLCAFSVHALHLEDCPNLPECNLDDITDY